MTEKNFILATAGHVDHGKSALVKALTGTDPDRLPEEKARKITIELGFGQLILDGPNEHRLHRSRPLRCRRRRWLDAANGRASANSELSRRGTSCDRS